MPPPAGREKILSGVQYATGWLLIFLFGWGFILPFFFFNLPSHPLLFPSLIVTFFTHAVIGVRSTTLKYRLWRPVLDGLFLILWLLASVIFLYTYFGR